MGLASSAVAEADDKIGIAEGSDHAAAINRAWRKLDKDRKEEMTSDYYKEQMSKQELPTWKSDPEAIWAAEFKEMMEALRKCGAPEWVIKRISYLVEVWKAIFSGNITEASKCTPFRLDVVPGPAARHKAQPLGPFKAAQLRKHLVELCKMNVIGEVFGTNPEFVSPIVMVDKLDNTWRVCLDLRKLNLRTMKTSFLMPHISELRECARGCTRFATFDLCKGYWQIEIEESLRHYFTFVVPGGKFQLKRMPMGACGASEHMQAEMSRLFGDMEGIAVFQDDILLCAKDDNGLLELLEIVFKIFAENGLKLKLPKVTFWAKEVIFVGHLFTGKGVTASPKRIQGLIDMAPPVTVGELNSLICSGNFVRSYLIDYAKIVEPFQQLVTRILGNARGAARKRAGNTRVKWTSELKAAYKNWKRMLANRIMYSHRHNGWSIFTCSDAAPDAWGCVIAQCPPGQDEVPLHELNNVQILAMDTGTFKGSRKNWAIPDKEAFALAQPFILHPELLHSG